MGSSGVCSPSGPYCGREREEGGGRGECVCEGGAEKGECVCEGRGERGEW